MTDRGLYKKYTVTNNETGETEDKVFVLKPVADPAAREALLVYATYVLDTNPELRTDLIMWINAIEQKHGAFNWREYWEKLDKEAEEEVEHTFDAEGWV